MIDLHLHSTCSDGSDTPYNLARLCAKEGIRAVSLTDHDTVDGLLEFDNACMEFGIPSIPGIEFSCHYDDIEIHILGYFVNYNDVYLQQKLNTLKVAREERNMSMIKKLQNVGICIDYKQLLEYAKGNIISRGHIASLLVSKGVCNTTAEAFKYYIGSTSKFYVKKEYFSFKDCLSCLHKNGAITSLAHPMLYKIPKSATEKLVKSLKNEGIHAIESYYSQNSKKDTAFLCNLANKYNLYQTGGSDYHGDFKKNVSPGMGGTPFAIYEDLLALKDNLCTI